MKLKIALSRMLALCAVVGVFPAAALATDATLTDLQRFASDGSEDAADGFGDRVSVNGDVMVVGTGMGEALVYRQQPDRTWVHEQTLANGSLTFGIDVATNGTKIAVLDSELGPSVYAYVSSVGSWVLNYTQNLAQSDRLFRRLDLVESGDFANLVVSCVDGTTPNIFMMDYVFSNLFFWWTVVDTLDLPSSANSNFGKAVALDTGWLLVGNPLAASPRAFIFVDGSQDDWLHYGTLYPDISVPDNFGTSVALDGDYAVVSGTAAANLYDEAGKVLVFKHWFGPNWNQVASLTPTSTYFNRFGHDVAISDEAVVVTSPANTITSFSMGYATMYRMRDSDSTWPATGSLISSYQPGGGQAEGYSLGQSAALHGDTVVLGADGGTQFGTLDLPGKVHTYDIDITQAKFWSGAQSNNDDIGDDENWDGVVGSDGFFSGYGAVEEHFATMDGSTMGDGETLLNELVVRLNTRIDLNDLFTDVGEEAGERNALSVYGSDSSTGAVCDLVGPGHLHLLADARIGLPGRAGLLSLRGDASVSGWGHLHVGENGALSLNLKTGYSVQAAGGSLRGGLTVPEPVDMSIAEGDQFTLVWMLGTAPPPGEDRFGIVMLPIVGENLGLELEYVGGQAAGYLTVKATAVTMDDLVEFDPPESLTEAGFTLDMVSADLDGDDADEVCVLYAGSPGTIGIYSSSTSGLSLQHTLNTGYGPKDITRGDFNNDGYQDLAVANFSDGNITVYFGTGTLTSFTTDTFAPSEGRPECISRTDWDGVGGDDLVAGLRVSDPQGEIPDTGAFEIFTFSSNFGPGGGMGGGGANGSPGGVPSVFGDPSDDEDQKDLPFSAGDDHGNAVGGRGGSGLTSDMVFEIVQVGADITSLSMRDLDGDGEKDLVVAVASTDTLAIIKGGTNGSIETNNPVYLPVAGSDPASLIAEDLNGDGKIDLAWIQTNDGDRVMQIAQSIGDFSFTSLDAGTDQANFLMAADITGSGTLDMLTVNTGSGVFGAFTELSLLEQVCPGDADGNDVVDIEDLLIVIGEWNQTCDETSPCTADFDNNGIINIEDLLIVIGYYGPC